MIDSRVTAAASGDAVEWFAQLKCFSRRVRKRVDRTKIGDAQELNCGEKRDRKEKESSAVEARRLFEFSTSSNDRLIEPCVE